MSIQEIKAEIAFLQPEERRELAAFLVSLRHGERFGYRTRMARKIDDLTAENWVTLDELDLRLDA